jgi:hypothetical protein
MEWLLIVGMIFVFIFGLYLMKRIDKFFDKKDVSPEEHKPLITDRAFALVFGSTELSDELVKILKSNAIDYEQIDDENQLYEIDNYSHLFAISDNDVDNLLICVVADRSGVEYQKIARCNSLDNQNIYHQNHIPYLSGETITAQSLYRSMFSNT